MCGIDFVAPVIRFAVLRGPSVTTDTVASVALMQWRWALLFLLLLCLLIARLLKKSADGNLCLCCQNVHCHGFSSRFSYNLLRRRTKATSACCSLYDAINLRLA